MMKLKKLSNELEEQFPAELRKFRSWYIKKKEERVRGKPDQLDEKEVMN